MTEKRAHILIVEDDLGLSILIGNTLDSAGYSFTAVRSGKEALETLLNHPVDLVLLDYSLPDMNAIQMIETAKKQDIPLQFIVITGQGDERIAVEMMKRGAKDYLNKDSSLFNQLIQVIERALKEIQTKHDLELTQSALRASEERFRTLFQTMAQGVVYQDADGKIILANPAAHHILGIPRESIIGSTSEDPQWITVNENGEPMSGTEHPSMLALSTGKMVRDFIMGIFNHADQTTHWIVINAIPLFAPGEKKPYQVYTTFTDITELRNAKDKIQQLNVDLENRILERTSELETAYHELESFSYAISHNLRAPLRAINGYSRIIMEDYAPRLDDQARAYLDRIAAGANQLSDLMDALLVLSHLVKGEVDRKQVNLSQMADNIMDEFQQVNPARKLELKITPNLTANADAKMIYVVMRNLLENAWKFTSKCEVAKIEFEATHHDGLTEYTIKDNGIGFDMAYIDKIFAPFQKLNPPGEFEGTGIGLASVQKIIQHHNGKIRAEGTLGAGASFYFTIGE